VSFVLPDSSMQPDVKTQEAIDRAKECGTYQKTSRSGQYLLPVDEIAARRKLLNNDDLIFEKLRDKDNRDFWHKCVLYSLALVPNILAFLMWLYR